MTATASRLLVAGDWHGDISWAEQMIRAARHHGCDGVLQLGDFGMWVGDPPAPLHDEYTEVLADICEQHEVWVRFVDGNHDDHPDWRAAYPARADGIRPIRDGVLDWADRAAVWEWSGVKFGALGGAISIDREYLAAGWSWWPTEETSLDDVHALADRSGGSVDILVCHDAPILPDGSGRLDDPVLDADCARNRSRIGQAAIHLQPSLLLHGHYHRRRSTVWHGIRVEGFAAGERAGAWAVLDLDGLTLG